MTAAAVCIVMTACSGPEPSAQAPPVPEVEHEVATPLSTETDVAGGSARAEGLASLVTALGSHRPDERSLQDALRLARGDRRDPMWPVARFASAEALMRTGQEMEALAGHRDLAEWSADDPYEDTWAGSGLGIISLWRWASLLEARDDINGAEVDRLLAAHAALERYRRLGERMFAFGFLDSLPQIEEDLYRRLALLAFRAERHDQAHVLFLRYLERSSTPTLSRREQEIVDHLEEENWASPAEIGLVRAKRLAALHRYDLAEEQLESLRRNESASVRARAGLELARLIRRTGRKLDKTKTMIQNVDAVLEQVLEDARRPDLIQEALMFRVITFNRYGRERDPEIVLESLNDLWNRFPSGSKADDAKYFLASFYHDRFVAKGDPRDREEALGHYRELREYAGVNDWTNLSRFRPAILLYAGDESDQREAQRLLIELREVVPSGPLDRTTRFWLGRLDEDAGREPEARRWFKGLATDRWDYLSIRARMHLETGQGARSEANPGGDVEQALAQAMRKSPRVSGISGSSPYHQRLEISLNTGIYADLMARRNSLRGNLKERLQLIPLEELDSDGRLTQLAILLALRQDVMAARDSEPSGRNHLEVQAAVAEAGDWSLSAALAIARGSRFGDPGRIQAQPGYLATSYPSVEAVLGPALARLADTWKAPVPLLYAIIRRESLFDAAAWSEDAAIGYFQITPATFRAFDDPTRVFKWDVLRTSGKASREEFLLTPDLSLSFGTRYIGEYLLPRNRGDLMRALVEHNAGDPVLRRWQKGWENLGLAGDVEYVVASMRYVETRALVQGVLTDFWLMSAARSAGDSPAPQVEERP